MRLLLVMLLLCAAPPVAAETFRLFVGGNQIGTLQVTAGGIDSQITNSPLGVGNGRFSATSRPVQLADGRRAIQYLSDTPSKGRKISVIHADGAVIETTVVPQGDATDMSLAAAVPRGVVDPIAAMRHLLADRTECPGGLRFYEGRRVVTLSPSETGTEDGILTCAMAYRVTNGPGHLSPLFIKRATITLRYGGGTLQELALSNGPVTLRVMP